MSRGKYDPLHNHLKNKGFMEIRMTFSEIEKVLGAKLPPSAFKHRPWWSNNPSNSVITYAWLKAGYKTANVDMEGRRLTFRKFSAGDTDPAAAAASLRSGMDEKGRAFVGQSAGASRGDVFAALYGAMKGTIKFAKGFDPLEPAWTEDDTRAFDERWDRLLAPAGQREKSA